jgi:hypothetical protein
MWAETNQCMFYAEEEEVAVADHFIATITSGYQQVSGKSLRQGKVLAHLPHAISDRILKKALALNKDFKAEDNDMYLYKTSIEMVWPYDDRGRLVDEGVWEPQPDKGELIKLAPSEVLTTAEAAKLLNPLIKPLPSFDRWCWAGARQHEGGSPPVIQSSSDYFRKITAINARIPKIETRAAKTRARDREKWIEG